MKRRIINDIPDYRDAYKYRGQVFEMYESPLNPSFCRFKPNGDDGGEISVRKAETVEADMFEPKSGMIFKADRGLAGNREEPCWGFFIEVGGRLVRIYQNYDKFKTSKGTDKEILFDTYGTRGMDTDILEVYEGSPNAVLNANLKEGIGRGKRVYPAEVKELTLQEVADKFGIPVEQLRIKDANRSS